jgi:hypothetical protein
MTTKVKKKGVWAYQEAHKGKREMTEAPGAGGRAFSLSQLILCKKQRSALGQRLILQFHSHRKILQPVINLTLGCRKKFSFIPGKDLGPGWSSV